MSPLCYFTLCPITEEFKIRVRGRDKVEMKPGVQVVQYYKCDLIVEVLWFLGDSEIAMYRKDRRLQVWKWLRMQHGFLREFVSVLDPYVIPWRTDRSFRMDFLGNSIGDAERYMDIIRLVVNRGYRSVLTGLDLLPEHLRETREYLGD